MGRKGIRQRGWKKKKRVKETKRKVKRWQRCEESSLGSRIHNLIVWVCVSKSVCFCLRLLVHLGVLVCVGGVPLLVASSTRGQQRGTGHTAVPHWLWPCPLGQSLTASWPLTAYQLTWPGGWEREDKGRGVGEGYVIARELGEKWSKRERKWDLARLFSMASAEEPKVRASGGRERP